MEVMSRKEAMARGLTKYFTGKPCKNGHVAERYVSGTCAVCALERGRNNKEYFKDRYAQKREEILEYQRSRYYEKGGQIRANVRAYRSRNKIEIRARDRERYWADPQRHSDIKRKYRDRNRDRISERSKRYREENAEKIALYSREYRRNNPEVNGARNGRRRAWRRDQTCTCCTPEHFRAIYADAQALGHEVDHIEPLALGGLHCRHNLQLLTPEQHKDKTRDDLARIAEARRNSQAA